MPDTKPYAPTDPDNSSALLPSASTSVQLALTVPVKGRDGVTRPHRLGSHVKLEKTAAQHE